MNRALPLRPVSFLHRFRPLLPGRPVPWLFGQQVEGGPDIIAVVVRKSGLLGGPPVQHAPPATASASLSRLPRTASQKGSACSPEMPSTASRSRASRERHVVQQRAVERDQSRQDRTWLPTSRSTPGRSVRQVPPSLASAATFSDVPISTASEATAIGSMPCSRRLRDRQRAACASTAPRPCWWSADCGGRRPAARRRAPGTARSARRYS